MTVGGGGSGGLETGGLGKLRAGDTVGGGRNATGCCAINRGGGENGVTLAIAAALCNRCCWS